MKTHFATVIAISAICLMNAGMQVTAYAATSDKCGDDAFYTVSDDGRTLTVSGTGSVWKNWEWDAVYDPEFKASNITSLVVEDGITDIPHIGYGLTGLKNISLPASVTSIGSSAFYKCSSLETFAVPDHITKIEDHAFDGCVNLCLSVPSSVKTIVSWAFSDVPLVTYSGAAEGSPWDAYCLNGYQDGYLIYADDKKRELVRCLPKVKGSLTIPESVTVIWKRAFQSCTSLTSITLPEGISEIGDFTFNECTALTSVNLPNSLTYIGDKAFCECRRLFPSIPSSVKSIGEDAFLHVPLITCYGEAEGSPWGAYSRNGYIEGKLIYSDETMTELVRCLPDAKGVITIPSSVNSIADNAFYNCYSITDVVLPDGLATIGKYAFRSCSNLLNINIPDGVTSIGEEAFYSCLILNRVTVPESVTTIGKNAFYLVPSISYSGTASGSPWGALSMNGVVDGMLIYKDDSKKELLKCMPSATGDIMVPEGVETIGSYAFYRCKDLTSITLPASVRTIGKSCFAYCKLLTEITIPRGVERIETTAFQYCTSVERIALPEGLQYIGSYAFSHCEHLRELHIPNSVSGIWSYAFSFCYSLERTNIPASVTKLLGYTYSACRLLDKAVIPDNVTEIGASVFKNCHSLKHIIIPQYVTKIAADAFSDNCWAVENVYNGSPIPQTITDNGFMQVVYDNATLYVPAGSEDAYNEAEGWRNFKDIRAGCTVIFLDGEDNVADALIVEHGKTITPPEMPEKEGFNIVWKAEGSLVTPDRIAAIPVTKNITYTVVYTQMEDVVLYDNLSAAEYAAMLDEYKDKDINLTLQRRFNAGEWTTICLPFSLESLEDTPLDGIVYEMHDATTDDVNGITVYFRNTDVILAGRPYIVRPSEEMVNPVFNGVRLVSFEAKNVASPGGDVEFRSVTEPGLLTARTSVFLQHNRLYYPNSTTGSRIRAFRAYFEFLHPERISYVPSRICTDT